MELFYDATAAENLLHPVRRSGYQVSVKFLLRLQPQCLCLIKTKGAEEPHLLFLAYTARNFEGNSKLLDRVSSVRKIFASLR
jgi:hypothetical protein